MARAAAKRKPPARHHDDAYRKKHKDSGGQRYEDTLFFSRIRKQAKWVFVLLIVAFGLGFVLFGVGSSNLGGLSDIFNGISGGGGSPSIDKPLKRTQQNPKDAVAWKDLATAYDAKQDYQSAIPAWEQYTTLRPKDDAGLQALAGDLQQQFDAQTNDAALAQSQAQNGQATNFGPPSDSPLGRALGSTPDPIGSAVSEAANAQFQNALSARQTTATQLVGAYQKLAKLDPAEPSIQLQLGQQAQAAGDTATAIAAYQTYLKLAPDEPSAPQVKAQLKQLKAQSTASTSSSGG
jgi:hypothetical protein